MSKAREQSAQPTAMPVAHVIDASGADGGHGRNGRRGRDGVKGEDGERYFLARDRMDGAPGGPGTSGRSGSAGRDATAGGRLMLALSGDPQALQLRGAHSRGQALDSSPSADPTDVTQSLVYIDETVDLNHRNSEGLLLLRAQGGDGGFGGAGGRGGKGGSGGRGLNGAHGGAGASGDDGGDGGRAGHGGQGGDGGQGGSGGDGGEVIIRGTDPRLFVLVRADVRGGDDGHGGDGGRGGSGGAGGAPGRGGGGGSSNETHPFGGNNGSNGRPGKHGSTGREGRDGRPGLAGRDGRVVWQVVDASGQVIEQAERPFALTIEGYHLRGERDDAVFEPGEAISLHDIVLHNPGGLTLPDGVRLSLAEGAGLAPADEAQALTLPALAPGERRVIPGPLPARLGPADTPSRGEPLRASVDLQLRATLLGREFTGVDDPSSIAIQHAVEVVRSNMPPRVLAGETAELTLTLRNVSDAVIKADEVQLRLSLPDGLRHTGEVAGAMQAPSPESASQAPADQANGDEARTSETPNTRPTRVIILPSGMTMPVSGFGAASETEDSELHLLLPKLEAQSEARVTIGLRVERDLAAYGDLPWAFELWLRGHAIEIRTGATIASPRYEREGRPAPVLLVGGDGFTRHEYLAWARIFETLSLPFEVWDADRDGSAASVWPERHAGGLLVLPVAPHGQPPDTVPTEQILRHFALRDGDPGPVTRFSAGKAPLRSDAGMLVWGAETGAFLTPLFAPAPNVPPHGTLVKRFGLKLRHPRQKDIDREANRLRKALEAQRPGRRWRVGIAGDVRRAGLLGWQVGSAQVFGLRLRAGHRLAMVPPGRSGRIFFTALAAPAGFPLAEDGRPFITPRTFTRAFTAVLTALPLPLKLHALRAVLRTPPTWRLAIPVDGSPSVRNESWDVAEVVGRAIAEEVESERRRAVLATENGDDLLDPWAAEGGSDQASTDHLLDVATEQANDPTALPRLEILRADLLARPDRYAVGDGPRIVRAILEHMGDRRHLIALSRQARILGLRASRTRKVAREIEGALQAVGAGEDSSGKGNSSGATHRGETERLPATALARSWRKAPAWAWAKLATEPTSPI